MFEISKEFRFEASHQLIKHDGKCARLHGHSWVGRVFLRSVGLIQYGSKEGMVKDFGDVKAALEPLLENFLDHHHLNDTLGIESPTSERVSRWVFDQLIGVLPQLYAVEIEETCTSRARYQAD